MSSIFEDDSLIIDPKRWCPKYRNLLDKIEAVPHFRLGDVLEFVHTKFKKKPSETYRYVEIEKIFESFGSYEWQEFKGWNLAGRAKHVAKPGDIFIAEIWSSVGKWFMAGADAASGDLIVTSGCYHLRVKAGSEALLPDLVFGLSTEMFRVQMRALATGSDGLSVVSERDLTEIMFPRISDPATRKDLQERIGRWTTDGEVLAAIVAEKLKKDYPDLAIAKRPSHVAQV
jgi:type I restriction enzyme M protein